jgi:O-antigen/teichoic acid export membrane protein
LVLLFIAEPASRFFREPRLEPVIYVLALMPLLTGFENIGIVEFQKQLTFDREFKFVFAKKLAAFLVVVPLAVLLRSYWALVVGAVTGRAVGLILSYVLQPYRPRFSLQALHELFHFSKWLYISNMSRMLLQRAPDLVIGRIAGPRALGLFTVSHEIAYLPTTELVAPINRAAYPGYAKKSADLGVLRRGFLDVWSVICLIMVPAALGMLLTADFIVPLFLGDKWMDARPLIRLLAIAGLLLALQTNTTYIFFALGKPRVASLITVVYVGILLPVLAIATRAGGPIGASWAYVAMAGAVLPIRFAILQAHIDLRTSAILDRVWRPLVGTAIMTIVVLGLRSILPTPESLHGVALQFLLVVVTGGVVYVGSAIGLWRMSGSPVGAESFVLELVTKKIGAWRASRGGRSDGATD